jgi:hypothetical protein
VPDFNGSHVEFSVNHDGTVALVNIDNVCVARIVDPIGIVIDDARKRYRGRKSVPVKKIPLNKPPKRKPR